MGPRQVSEGQMTPSLFLSKKATCFCSGVICISSSPSLPTETKTLTCETSVVAREESNLLPEEEDEEIIVFGWARRLRKWRRQVWLGSNVPQYRVGRTQACPSLGEDNFRCVRMFLTRRWGRKQACPSLRVGCQRTSVGFVIGTASGVSGDSSAAPTFCTWQRVQRCGC